ncbi:MAG: PLP-dependent aspartate aminotransferase family protein [Lachnospiraceae bacterium]|nr:PLP-dependent aspartate aminotransferase family protein [Lachnospiraceae bacterium]
MNLEIDTKCIHGERHKHQDANCALSYPIYQTASFSHLTPGHNPSGFDYSRESNPTRTYLEETVSSLEQAYDTVAFASGMAAIATAFELFAPGDHILLGEDLYGGVVRFITQVSTKNGYHTEYVDTSDINCVKEKFTKQTRAVYFETPTNPMMHVTDIRAIAEIAHAHGALVIVDNTLMSPYFQNPIPEGADLVVHSGTKYISGHNDTICGFLCASNAQLAERIRLLSKTTGATLGPFEAWLCLRGLKTLALRMERHKSNAIAVRDFLSERNDVEEVRYAGSGMLTFSVNSSDLAQKILKNIKLITFAESLGGTESLLTYPIIQTHPDVPDHVKEKLGITDKLLRLSVGIENPKDIIEDLRAAFES